MITTAILARISGMPGKSESAVWKCKVSTPTLFGRNVFYWRDTGESWHEKSNDMIAEHFYVVIPRVTVL